MQFLIDHIRSLDKKGLSWIPATHDRRGYEIPIASFVKMKEAIGNVSDECVQRVVRQLDVLIKQNS